MNDGSLTFEIKNSSPIELSDLTASLNGFAQSYEMYLDRYEPMAAADGLRLYVKEIKSGSVIAELVPYAAAVLPFVGQANTAITFCKHLKAAYDWLTGASTEQPELDKAELQSLASIVEPIAKDRGSQLNISAIYGNVYFNLDSIKANAAQNAAKRQIAGLQAPTSGLHEKALLYWYQARGDLSSTTGDRAVIESISRSPVKTVFANEAIKMHMVLSQENPFKEAYVVDVVVETIRGKPALYKITTLHEKFERDG